MVKATDCPDIRDIRPPAGKAALVIAETTRYENYDLEDNPDIRHFLDRKFIGTIKSHSFLVAAVEPGNHYVTANGENFETLLLNFEAGKTYFLVQERSMGLFRPRTRYVQVKADRVSDDLNGNRSCYTMDAQDPGNDLDEDTFAKIVADYTRKYGNKPLAPGETNHTRGL